MKAVVKEERNAPKVADEGGDGGHGNCRGYAVGLIVIITSPEEGHQETLPRAVSQPLVPDCLRLLHNQPKNRTSIFKKNSIVCVEF